MGFPAFDIPAELPASKWRAFEASPNEAEFNSLLPETDPDSPFQDTPPGVVFGGWNLLNKDWEPCTVKIADCSIVVIQSEFLRLTETDNPPIISDRSHVSDKLAILNQAAQKFWGSQIVDRNDPTTHSKNQDVIAWLIERRFSKTLAESAASIIRPEWAAIGRPPEK